MPALLGIVLKLWQLRAGGMDLITVYSVVHKEGAPGPTGSSALSPPGMIVG